MTDRGGGRPAKVAARIQEELSQMFLRGEIHEPDVKDVLVSSVRVTPDLSLAHVGVRLLETQTDAARQKRVVEALRRATGFVRKTLSGRLGLRAAPDLRFHWDVGVDHALRIDELLGEVAAERTEREPEGGR